MSNVLPLRPDGTLPCTPNDALVDALEQLLSMAKSGQLQSYIGSGFTSDGMRVTTWCDFHNDKYQVLGSLEWLKAQYIEEHTR